MTGKGGLNLAKGQGASHPILARFLILQIVLGPFPHIPWSFVAHFLFYFRPSASKIPEPYDLKFR